MKNALLLLSLVFCSALNAQGTFRIYDAQMNDVTGGILYISDTNAATISVHLTMENTDTNSHEVTAGRLVLSQPATASNAFTWGSIGYTPNVDSSAIPEFMSPAGTAQFVGDYYPNNNNGLCTINYCVWETGNMNNNSCVTVTFDNIFPAGVTAPLAPPAISYSGLSDDLYFVGVGWGGAKFSVVNLYSCDGKLIESRDVRGEYECEFSVFNLPHGIYMISCVAEDGDTWNSRFVR